MNVRLASLHIYPVKSLAGISVAEAEVGPRGFRHDRRFMLVRAKPTVGTDGENAHSFVTAREYPSLVCIETSIDRSQLRLTFPSRVSASLDALSSTVEFETALHPTSGEPMRVRVWDDVTDALAPDPAIDAAFSAFLGTPVRFVYQPETARRPVAPEFATHGEQVSFADGFPFLATSTSSLAHLRTKNPAVAAVPMSRFRPNLVLDGLPPFAEDTFAGFDVGGVRFHSVKPCERCVMVDAPSLGESFPSNGKESSLLATVAREHTQVYRGRRRAIFGANMLAEYMQGTGPAVLRVGDLCTMHS